MTCVIHCYAVLAIVSNSYPPLQGRLPTRYSPVRNSSKKSKLLSSAFYLHVLGTPPAFVLSQDQTLINTLIIVRALTHYRRLTIYSCKLTGYNSSIITLHLVSYSVLKGLCLSWDNFYILSNLKQLVNYFFKVFFKSVSIWLLLNISDNSYISVSSQTYFVNFFFRFSVSLTPALLRQLN